MSDDGPASNAGMTDDRYTLAGNFYGVYAADSSGASISSYVLDDPARVCVPLPVEVAAEHFGSWTGRGEQRWFVDGACRECQLG